MSKVVAFTYKVTDVEQLQLANKCLKVLGAEYRLLNIPNHRVEDHLAQGSTVITFGKLAGITVKQYITEKKLLGIQHIELPTLKNLFPIAANKEARHEAMQKLKHAHDLLQLDIYQPHVVLVSENDIPDLDARQIVLLQKMTEEAGKTSCFQTTKNGKLIEISNKPLPSSKADIHLTFQELYTLRAMMDILGVSSAELITTQETNREESVSERKEQ